MGVTDFTTRQVHQLARLMNLTYHELIAVLNLNTMNERWAVTHNRFSGAAALILSYLRNSLAESKGFRIVDGELKPPKRKE